MALAPGSRIGPYEVTALIGEGGMGKVWRAHHSGLKRDDALKVLPDAFAADRDRLARFQREAQVLASLNHPNIAHVHGLEQSDGVQALVMELVDGPTLADRIAQGPIPVDEALPIAKQIAEALEAAHERGIIHRDLKPANIKVRPDGTVKVLDFGLAKALEPTTGTRMDATASPTITSPAMMTGIGVLLGTAAYMSPEQARGKAVDKRSDIWAFGCVLYEMLTGRPVFGGDDVADILGAVLKTEPDWKRLPANVPLSVQRLLRLCLEKSPRNRRSDASDVRIDIEHALKEPDIARIPSASVPRRRGLVWIAAATTTLAVVAIAMVAFRAMLPPQAPEMRLDITTPLTLAPLEFALSPDGRNLAFVAAGDGAQRLWIRPLDKADAQPLAGTEDATYPFWSPDSRSVGFFANGKLKRIEIAGGLPQVLTDARIGRGGAWNADDTILFSPDASGPLFRIPASGGEPVPATRIGTNQQSHRFPEFLPDGDHFLVYVQSNPETQGIYLGSLNGEELKRLTAADAAGAYLAPNRILFIRQGALVARQIDLTKEELVGAAETVASLVGSDVFLNAGFSVSADGRIAYRGGGPGRTQLVWYDRTGKSVGVASEADPNALLAPELSPDGRRVVADRTVQGNRDVWLLDLFRGGFTRLTFDSAVDGYPVWSPDGKVIAFESNRQGSYRPYSKPASGVGEEEILFDTPNNVWPLDWSRDGRFFLYHEDNPTTGSDIWALPMTGGDRQPIAVSRTRFAERTAQFSPDARFVAYDTDESGQLQILVQPFPNPNDKWQVSMGGGSYPRWRADGKELYFIAPDGMMMAVTVDLSASSFESETPRPLFQTRMNTNLTKQQYAVAPDGRFLINQSVQESSATPITLILNWRPRL